jgi:hypothetical protein
MIHRSRYDEVSAIRLPNGGVKFSAGGSDLYRIWYHLASLSRKRVLLAKRSLALLPVHTEESIRVSLEASGKIQ